MIMDISYENESDDEKLPEFIDHIPSINAVDLNVSIIKTLLTILKNFVCLYIKQVSRSVVFLSSVSGRRGQISRHVGYRPVCSKDNI